MTERVGEPAETPAKIAPVLGYAGESLLAAHGDLFRDGPILVARDGVTLIPYCVLCGEPSGDKSLKLKFTWDPSFKVTRRSTLQMRAAGTVVAALCPRHQRRWKSGRLMGAIGMTASGMLMAASIVAAIISESSDIPRYAPHAIATLLAGFAIFIGFLFLFTLKTRTLKCARIEAGYVYLEGVHEEFLKRLPELPAEHASPA